MNKERNRLRVDELRETRQITISKLEDLLGMEDEESKQYLYHAARETADFHFGKKIYLRGLIEFTNYCKNNCYYCGIRRDNSKADRYRLTEEQILSCAQTGYTLGFRTFVLQGGEDVFFTDEKICRIVRTIRTEFPDCAITLSIGEKSRESYAAYREAGADRYLLRHETADRVHYEKIHPDEMSFDNRRRCLYDLKELGYQVGCGFMVGSPFQDISCLFEDLQFIRELQPHMVGIGPFISQGDTPFSGYANGTLERTLKLLAILRLMNPKVLLPATTALGTIHPRGRELGILAGANVVMPNLSPVDVRAKYLLYDNKICTGEEAAECIGCMAGRIKLTGYEVSSERGDHPDVAV